MTCNICVSTTRSSKEGREYRACMYAVKKCVCGPELDLKMSLETRREESGELLAVASSSYFCA